MYIVAAPLAGAFGGLLASGILKLKGIGSVHTWQQLFLVEGIITIGLAIIGYFTLTDHPATARWLTQEEKDLAIARVKSENVGTTEIIDKLDVPKIMRGIFNPNTLATSFIFLLDNVTVQGLAFFLPTIVKTIYPKYTTIQQQLWTVPPYVVGAFFTVFVPYLTMKMDRRVMWFIISAPFMMVGYIMFLATTNNQVRYGATFLITTGAFSFGAMCNAQVSANALSDTARSAGIGTNVMFGNVGGLISTWAFLPYDDPSKFCVIDAADAQITPLETASTWRRRARCSSVPFCCGCGSDGTTGGATRSTWTARCPACRRSRSRTSTGSILRSDGRIRGGRLRTDYPRL